MLVAGEHVAAGEHGAARCSTLVASALCGQTIAVAFYAQAVSSSSRCPDIGPERDSHLKGENSQTVFRLQWDFDMGRPLFHDDVHFCRA